MVACLSVLFTPDDVLLEFWLKEKHDNQMLLTLKVNTSRNVSNK